MSGHTPGPWAHGEEFQPARFGHLPTVVSIHCRDVAQVVAHVNGGFGNGKENAEFIVRACNAHDELVAALTELVDPIAYNEKGTWEPDLTRAKAILEKVKA